jgi:eukaryotic-like serine/threonine-protein kinase
LAQDTIREGELVTFLRKRDYKLVRELGQGACGQTVLLHDEQIDQHFVCKKYVPYASAHRQELFQNFIREIKLLHQVHHENVVRVFNHYLYPEQFAGYILMEFIDGTEIDEFVAAKPELLNETFLQAIRGFSHLERSGILHRDIRPGNLMVRSDGTLKIIDLGFGKRVESPSDFDKSITLNWWCEVPDEFKESKYDFKTEVYFVGRLFEKLIQENQIDHFKYQDLLRSMCSRAPATRIATFSEIERTVDKDLFLSIDFSEQELATYRAFASALARQTAKIESSTKYVVDIARIVTQLNDAYRNCMLDEQVPDAAMVLRCFLSGTYHYKKGGFVVSVLRDFLVLLKSSSDEKKRVIVANLHAKLDAIQRYEEQYDDIPF